MKTSAPILVSFAVGALVVLALHWHESGAQAAGGPPSTALAAPLIAEPAAARAAGISPSPARRVQVDGAARINIPRLHLKVEVGRSVDAGPAWWPVTGRPGGGDTIALAGHRTTHTHPFLDLDLLEPGDAIYVRWQGVAHRYVVSGRRIVSNQQRHIADARGYELLILSTCTPKGSSRQRLLVYAKPDPAPAS